MASRRPIGAALRELRKGRGIKTQTAAGQLPGAPDFRTLSHWETGRKERAPVSVPGAQPGGWICVKGDGSCAGMMITRILRWRP